VIRKASPTIVLAALKEELEPLRKALEPRGDLRLVRTGVGPRRAAETTLRQCAEAKLIISTGCCGGLVAGAEAGLLVIPERVLRWDGERAEEAPPPDEELVQLCQHTAERLGLHCSARPLATVERALHTPESKRACHRGCGAVAVDMESAAIAVAAAELQRPYVVVRYVLDRVDETLPDLGLVDGRGKLRPGAVLKAAMRPRELVTLASLAIRMRSRSGGLVRLVSALLESF
jgi:adenosylhomocysteine nucleosidase